MTTQEILEAARSAKSALALADNTARNAALLGMAWAGIRLVRQTANCSKDSPKKSLSILCIASMCRPATLLLLQLTIFTRSVLRSIKITFMPPSSIRRKVPMWACRF